VESSPGNIIQSVTGGNSGNNITSAVSFNVVYKSDLNTRAKGLSVANALTVNIYAVYNDGSANNGTERSIKLTASIRDCACCGAYTDAGAWLGFMCYNLGANESYSTPALQQNYTPTANTDSTVYGGLFQWGRKADGHEKRTSGTTSTLATSNEPGHNNFIITNNTLNDWRSGGGNNNRWGDGTTGTNMAKADNDPCPPGFKVPSTAQWESIAGNSCIWKNTNTRGEQIGDFLFLPAAGYRGSSNASLTNQRASGHYWNSTVYGTNAYGLYFDYSEVNPKGYGYRAFGFSVRCVVD
jgi:uncharacterized protein (TIGR02145 family)